MTMPLIRTMEVLTGRQREAFCRLLEGPPGQRIAKIYPFLEQAEAARYTRRRAGEFVAAAEAALDGFAPSEAKATLRRWAGFALERRC
jgi:octaprenyl-diphosphate synthase